MVTSELTGAGGSAFQGKPLLAYSREVHAGAPPDLTVVPAGFNLDLRRGDSFWDYRYVETRLRTGVVLRETLDVSALKGTALLTLKEGGPPSGDPAIPNDDSLGQSVGLDGTAGFDRVKFFPFVDGTYRATLRDVNDFEFMDRHICLILHHIGPGDLYAQALCGPPNSAGY